MVCGVPDFSVSVKYEAASLLLFWYGSYKAGASHMQYRNGGTFLSVFFPSKLDELWTDFYCVQSIFKI